MLHFICWSLSISFCLRANWPPSSIGGKWGRISTHQNAQNRKTPKQKGSVQPFTLSRKPSPIEWVIQLLAFRWAKRRVSRLCTKCSDREGLLKSQPLWTLTRASVTLPFWGSVWHRVLSLEIEHWKHGCRNCKTRNAPYLMRRERNKFYSAVAI